MDAAPVILVKRRAFILTTTADTSEVAELLFAVGAEVVGTLQQNRRNPDPQTFLGAGKMEEAAEGVRLSGADLVIVNGTLKPNQVFGIQRVLLDHGAMAARHDDAPELEVFDRTRLILEIFHERARSPEARLQVELAQLTYDMPLIKEAVHMLKKGERPGFLAGGSYEVDQHLDRMRGRMARIRRDLEKIRRERGVRRKHRRRGGFQLLGLAGYTNAGKSSLLRALSNQDTLVENRYFSTLATKTARVESDRREMLVTDTVGFIEDLPPWMVEAFHSTLEEIALADVVLLVLDASDEPPEMVRRLRSSLEVLWSFDSADAVADARARAGRAGGSGGGALGGATGGVAPGHSAARIAARTAAGRGATARGLQVPARRGLAPIVVALNKVDLVDEATLATALTTLADSGLVAPRDIVPVSARERRGLDELLETVFDRMPDYDVYDVALPNSGEGESCLAWLHDVADVLDLTRGAEVHVRFEAKRTLREVIGARLAVAGGSALREVRRASDESDGFAGFALASHDDSARSEDSVGSEDSAESEGLVGSEDSEAMTLPGDDPGQ